MKTHNKKNLNLKKYKSSITKLLTLLFFVFLAIPAHAVIITKSFTGLWHQPDHESQGFDFQIIDQNGIPQAVVYWYTFDTIGNPMWLIGVGNLEGNNVTMDLKTVTGITNLQSTNPAARNVVVLANAFFTFDDCNNGNVVITPSLGNGGLEPANSISGTGGIVNIKRFTTVQGSSCSGGIADNTTPQDTDESYQQFMGNTGIYPNGNARYEFEQDRDSSEFEVEIEEVPVGSYDLRVEGIIRGQIQVRSTSSSTEGKVEFESPVQEGKILLDFDPRNKLIEVLEQDMVLFTSEFTPTPGGNNDPGTNGAPPFANNIETEMYFNNTGLITSARGEVELEQEPNEVEFEVEIESLPLGNYTLFVGGVNKGIITVINDDGGREGEIEFRFPKEIGKPLLDFDPRGQLIEVRQNNNTILEVAF